MPARNSEPRGSMISRFAASKLGKTMLAVTFLGAATVFGLFLFYYVKYSRLIEEKLAAGPFANTSMLFASPRAVAVGDETSAQDVVANLRRAGYSESANNRIGHYSATTDEVDIYPGPDSYFRRDDGVIRFAGGKVSRIVLLADNTERTEYTLEPELMSNLFDKRREKRRLVRYEDIPKVLVNAIVAVEDKRFFQHAGFDPIRIVKAAYVDLKTQRYAQGASTLSQQLARQFWLDNDKTWRRKLPELLITMDLERKLTKEKIFEYYANQVPLGQRGSFGIRGVGEAAQVFFGKDVSRLTLAEAATLAGLIQQPSFTNPFRWPDRAKARRNVVLKAMRDNRYIRDEEYETASAAPIGVNRRGMESTDAPYFVDVVNDVLLEKFGDYDFQTNTFRIYTTIDLDLQRDATEAVRVGMEEVDRIARANHKKGETYAEPQVALVALDPITGQVKALIGGRNYGASQLNRALAKRQPGSSFKPFVYAAALNTALNGSSTVLTPATMLVDEPTTFWYGGRPYEPANFHGELMGNISMRTAFAHSLNIPTVKLAEQAGYGNVVDLARQAGMNMDIHPTPAVALGAYEVMPLEVAGAYTVFANHGVYTKPSFVASIGTPTGETRYEAKPDQKQSLDPRVAFLMDSLLGEVVRTGTGAGIWSRGIDFPVVGKTGSSRDGWFAGFTSNLLCVVWVGYDDNSDLKIEGARSALPVWAEFMKRAHKHRKYRNVSDFVAPAGIVSAQIDPVTGHLASAGCPTVRTEYFVEGTQPAELCTIHGGGTTRIAAWDATSPNPESEPAVLQSTLPPPRPNSQRTERTVTPVEVEPKKRGIFGKIRDIFK